MEKPETKVGSERSQQGRDERAEISADQSARAAWISALGAVVSAAVAIPGGIYSYRQISEINESAKSASDSLKQAKAALDEAKRIADGVGKTADATVRVADSNDLQATHLNDLAARAREQEHQLEGSRRAAETLAAAAQQQLELVTRANESSKQPNLTVRSVSFTAMHEDVKTNATVQFSNSGSTDPEEVEWWSSMVIAPIGKNARDFPVPACGSGVGGKRFTYGQGKYYVYALSPISHRDATLIDAGTHVVVAYGRACYSSGNSPPRMAKFCASAARAGGESSFCDH